MPSETRIVSPGTDARTVRTEDGQLLQAPADWELLPPGDATLTRRVKAAGASWTVRKEKGRRVFSLGVWAPAERIASLRTELEQERSTETYAKRRSADRARRDRHHLQYVADFQQAVVSFLNFAPRYAALAESIASAVTAHATPVGSGTVARTKRIPLARRAESAVIAWLRHQTTDYDRLRIPRVKGKRREVRRKLAEQSRQLLDAYRRGLDAPTNCPLQRAVSSEATAGSREEG